MKKLFISALFILTAVSYSFAGSTEKALSFKGADSFKKMFANASNIEVKNVGEYTSVKFTWNDEKFQAFYDKDGALSVTSRNIEFNRLPLPAITKISEKYADYKAVEVVELNSTEDGLGYYIALENNEKRVIVKSDTFGSVSVFKSEKK